MLKRTKGLAEYCFGIFGVLHSFGLALRAEPLANDLFVWIKRWLEACVVKTVGTSIATQELALATTRSTEFVIVLNDYNVSLGI